MEIIRDEVIELKRFLPNLKYYKFMKNHDLKKLYKDSNILIFPSVFDGWGVVPMEAMANKMFLIISKNCGVREIINKSEILYYLQSILLILKSQLYIV